MERQAVQVLQVTDKQSVTLSLFLSDCQPHAVSVDGGVIKENAGNSMRKSVLTLTGLFLSLFLLAASSLLGSIHPFSWFRPVPSCKLMNNALIMCARGCVSSYCLQ